MTLFTAETTAVEAIRAIALDRMKFRIKLHGDGLKERYPNGVVVDEEGEIIGGVDSYTYGGYAFALHTRNFAGYVSFDECEFVS